VCRSTCQQYWWERFPAAGGAALTSYMFTFTDPAAPNKDLLPAMMQQYQRGLEKYLGALWQLWSSLNHSGLALPALAHMHAYACAKRGRRLQSGYVLARERCRREGVRKIRW
jgi:hypothetical protein